MGAWTADSFGNDTALDYCAEVTGLDDLLATLKALEAETDYIDADLACEVLAAADIIAALIARPAPDLPDDLAPRLDAFATPDDATIAATTNAVIRIRAGSELTELWDEAEGDDWSVAIDALLARLDRTKPYTPPAPKDPADDITVEDYGGTCFICNSDIEAKEVVDITLEDEEFGVWSSMTLYAHGPCIVDRYDGPHFNADGTPTAEVVAQFKAEMAI